jgi:AraC-like DNA-binding protein
MVNAPVKWFETSLLAISAFHLFVVFVTMLWHIRRIQPASAFLLVWLFIAGVAMVMMFAIDTGLIVYAPWLFLLPSPLYYLLFPAGYLYIRMMVNDEVRLKKWDVLHFIPALIHFVELTPYLLQSSAYKLHAVTDAVGKPLGVFEHSQGILLEYQHNILRGLIGLGYSLAIFRIFRQANKTTHNPTTLFPGMTRWLKGFGWMQLLIAVLLVSILGIPRLAPPHVRATLLYMLIALSQTGTAMILIFNPNLMYGMPKFAGKVPTPLPLSRGARPVPLAKPKDETLVEKADLTSPSGNLDREHALLHRIEAFMDAEKPYLKQRYHTNDLSEDLSVPAHHISYALNHVLKLKYADYINQQRIDHMKSLVDSGELDNYTLEALALKSGFNSRVTFIRAVQKLKGINPSEYFKAGD